MVGRVTDTGRDKEPAEGLVERRAAQRGTSGGSGSDSSRESDIALYGRAGHLAGRDTHTGPHCAPRARGARRRGPVGGDRPCKPGLARQGSVTL